MNPQHIEFFRHAINRSMGNLFDDTDTVVGVDDLLSNTKFHKPSRNEGIIPEKPSRVKIYTECLAPLRDIWMGLKDPSGMSKTVHSPGLTEVVASRSQSASAFLNSPLSRTLADPGNRLGGIVSSVRANVNTGLDLAHMSVRQILAAGGTKLFSRVTAA